MNQAPREALLRIPGFGVRAVDRILRIRKHHPLTITHLAKLHIPVKRAREFVVTADSHPGLLDSEALAHRIVPPPTQLSLFSSAQQALTGEL